DAVPTGAPDRTGQHVPMVPPRRDPSDEGLEELILRSEPSGDQAPAVPRPFPHCRQCHGFVAPLGDEVGGGVEPAGAGPFGALLVRVPGCWDHGAWAQWLRRLTSTRRSPSKTTRSSWVTPQCLNRTTPASARCGSGSAASTSV